MSALCRNCGTYIDDGDYCSQKCKEKATMSNKPNAAVVEFLNTVSLPWDFMLYDKATFGKLIQQLIDEQLAKSNERISELEIKIKELCDEPDNDF